MKTLRFLIALAAAAAISTVAMAQSGNAACFVSTENSIIALKHTTSIQRINTSVYFYSAGGSGSYQGIKYPNEEAAAQALQRFKLQLINCQS